MHASRPRRRIRTPWIFTLGAGIYDAITRQEAWRRHCREMGRRVPGRRVLDLGVGPGVSSIELGRGAPERHLVGLDVSAAMLARAKRHCARARVRLSLVRGDATRLPFGDATYDAATGHSFLYLVADGDAVLREVHRVVRPGGHVVFLEPSAVAGPRRWTAVARAFREGLRFGTSMLLWSVFSRLHGRYSAGRLRAQLARCGFVAFEVSPALGGLGLVAVARRP
jgi:ubiquinone/menaquinone biosynthesis C-methylase UbiE